VASEIDYVISHPNGWEGYQQSQIREGVVLAGLIPDTTDGHARVSFVTEGEASLHFSIDNGLPAGAMQVCLRLVVTAFIMTYVSRLETESSLWTPEEELSMSALIVRRCRIPTPRSGHSRRLLRLSVTSTVLSSSAFMLDFSWMVSDGLGSDRVHSLIRRLDYLKESDFYEDLDHIVRCFDKSTKVRFSSDKQPQYIKFGGTRDNDAACNIRFGQLKLAG
jgi:hypothetical protein